MHEMRCSHAAPARRFNAAISKRILRLVALVALVGVVVAPVHPAAAQGTRVWLSGVGDDTNPCSRTAPCKSFGVALGKVAAGGEINVIDPLSTGAVTINKSITIKAANTMAAIEFTGGNGITVNAAATDKVTIRGLSISGLGAGVHGIRVVSAKTVKIVDNQIFGFTHNGISLENSATGGPRAFIFRNFIHDNGGAGVMVAPQDGVFQRANLRDNEVTENGCGLAVTQFGVDVDPNYAIECGTRPVGISSGAAIVSSFDNMFNENAAAGVFSRGPNAVNRISLNTVVNNAYGLRSLEDGQILSWGDNLVGGNSTDGSPTGPVIPSK